MCTNVVVNNCYQLNISGYFDMKINGGHARIKRTGHAEKIFYHFDCKLFFLAKT